MDLIRHNLHPAPVHSHNRRLFMKLVTALSTAAFVLVPAFALAQEPANGTGNTKDEPGLVNKVIEKVTGSPHVTNKSDADSSAESAGNKDYPDFAAVKKTG